MIWIYIVCKGRVYPGSAGLGLKERIYKGEFMEAYFYLLEKTLFQKGANDNVVSIYS